MLSNPSNRRKLAWAAVAAAAVIAALQILDSALGRVHGTAATPPIFLIGAIVLLVPTFLIVSALAFGYRVGHDDPVSTGLGLFAVLIVIAGYVVSAPSPFQALIVVFAVVGFGYVVSVLTSFAQDQLRRRRDRRILPGAGDDSEPAA